MLMGGGRRFGWRGGWQGGRGWTFVLLDALVERWGCWYGIDDLDKTGRMDG